MSGREAPGVEAFAVGGATAMEAGPVPGGDAFAEEARLLGRGSPGQGPARSDGGAAAAGDEGECDEQGSCEWEP